MKREIKFRAWDGTKMFCPVALKENGKVESNLWTTDNWIVMQYTGLKDRNGKEIYEGDVVNIGASDFDFIVDKNGNPVSYEVMVHECDYILYRIDLSLIWGRLGRLSEMNWCCEIIGNIYENPELLK